MVRKLACLVVGILILAVSANADWFPGDGHKMHFPQLPDEEGWNVFATNGQFLADDWLCSQSGPVDEIHFWGSWYGGVEGIIDGFTIEIYTDVPDPDPQDPANWSMPGQLLWSRDFPISEVMVRHLTPDPQLWEGWYNPITDETIHPDHDNYFQYNVVGIEDPFIQEQGTIYWLSITANVSPNTPDAQWGWKSSIEHWNDDATYFTPGAGWLELFEPDDAQTIVNDYFVTVDAAGNVINGGGTDFFGQGWYFYPEEGWWNIWFYDHPFDTERKKVIHIEFDAFPLGPGAYIEFAVNWSTDLWSIEQPPGDSAPPLPGVPEQLYIGRATLLASDNFGGHYVFDYEIPDYNPEWVSIDIRGFNFEIPFGFIEHSCVRANGGQSMDLSFVINEGDQVIGACCFPDRTCAQMTADSCVTLGGTYWGDNIPCTPNPCPQPQGACCVDDGTCYITTQALCEAAGDTYYGDGTSCTPNPCPQPATGACCDDVGGCFTTTQSDCEGQGFTYLGDASICLGDGDGNGVDDACEEPEGRKWHQPPDLSEMGMDVLDMFPFDVLADDFLCTDSGKITKVHVFGSWLNDQFPLGDPCSPTFELKLWSDIPNTGGTPSLPAPCPIYPLTPLVASEGLPPGTEMHFDSFFDVFTCIDLTDCSGQLPQGSCEGEGGSLGGNFQCFQAQWSFTVVGTGQLEGWSRQITLPVEFEIHTGPRNPGDPVQQFESEIVSMTLIGGLRADPDFEILNITAGSNFGLPSSGQTTLTRLPSGDFAVDSFFDITYDIEFEGTPGGVLDGLAGTTTGSVRMQPQDPTGGDCTAPDRDPTAFSKPGDELCVLTFQPGSYECRLYADNLNEGWMDPVQQFYTPNGDTQCWEYIFTMDDEDCFRQHGTPENPIVYWLSVQAFLQDDVWFFGWKSSSEHWNDDAVWALETGPPAFPWVEMRYIPPHPYAGESVDLAFSIYGQTGCCVIRGDIDHNGSGPDIADLVYLVAFMFNGGPPPPCMEEADVNGDGSAVPDIADLVYLVAYMFQGGPPPVPCP